MFSEAVTRHRPFACVPPFLASFAEKRKRFVFVFFHFDGFIQFQHVARFAS